MCSWLRTLTRSPLALTKVNGRPALGHGTDFFFVRFHFSQCPPASHRARRTHAMSRHAGHQAPPKPGEPRRTQPCRVLGTLSPTPPGRDPAILIIISLFFKRSGLDIAKMCRPSRPSVESTSN